MSNICPEYDNLTPIQKLQMQQLELDARNHDMAKIKEFIYADIRAVMHWIYQKAMPYLIYQLIKYF